MGLGLSGIAAINVLVLTFALMFLGFFTFIFYAEGAPTLQWTINGQNFTYIPVTNYQISITINNTDANNITEVNITIPPGMVYITDSNITTAQASNFTNSTDNLTWFNTTTGIALIENGTNETFLFNVSIPAHTPGLYNFTITITDNMSDSTSGIQGFMVFHSFFIGNNPYATYCSGCQTPAVNISNTTDFFFYNGNYIQVVVNLTNPLGSGVPNLTVTANLSEVGGNVSAAATYLGNGWYMMEGYVNFSNISGGVTNINPVNITVNISNETYSQSQTTPALLVNMNTLASCPPANENVQFPPMPTEEGNTTLVNPTSCNSTCDQDKWGFAEYNGSGGYWICPPQFGGDTTNFSEVANTGNFSNFTMIVDIPGISKIVFLQNVSFTTQESAQGIMEFAMRNLMLANRVGINDSEWDGSTSTRVNLTVSANITLYNLTGRFGISDPNIYYGSYNGTTTPGDLAPCPATRCYGYTWDGENLTFTVSSFSTYVIGDTLHNLTFENLTSREFIKAANQNATFIINITNWGNATYEEYNLSIGLAGTSYIDTIGTLNVTDIVLNQNESVSVELNVSNATSGNYSLYIIAYHWNGTTKNTTWSLNSSDDGIYFNLTVDADAPNNIYPALPAANNTNYTTDQLAINITFNETRPDTCILEFNNGTAVNITMTMNTTEKWCYIAFNQSDGYWNFSIYVNDTVGNLGFNGTWYGMTDTIAPHNITAVAPTKANSSYSSQNYFEVNVTFNETYPDTCIIEINNGSAANYTMTINKTGKWCYFNATAQADATITYVIYINDTSGNLASNGTYYITLDTTAPGLSSWNYSFVTKQLILVFNETMYAGTLNLSRFNITYNDGSVPSALNNLAANGAVINSTANSTTIYVNFTGVQDAAMRQLKAAAEGQIDMAAGAITDLAGNDVAAATNLNYTGYNTYTIRRPDSYTDSWSAGWHDFWLSYQILQTVSSLNSNYAVSNVLSSIANKYTIVYAWDGSSWTSYVPGSTNTLTAFNVSGDPHYYIRMNATGSIEIA